jgi:broad specificity phosphatase PhoE
MTEMDNLWQDDRRETIQELTERIETFFNTVVAQRPEHTIVVVTHGVWIETCLYRYCPQVLGYGKQRVYNCDMFSMDCVSTARISSHIDQNNGNQGTSYSSFIRLDDVHPIK